MKAAAILFLMFATVCSLHTHIIHVPSSVYIWERFERNPVRRPSSAPYLSGDTFRAFCDHVLDETKTYLNVEEIKAGDTIFVVADFLPYFFQDMYEHIQCPFVLVCHNRDDAIPGSYASYLDDEKIVAWFSVNIDRVHSKLHALPIGLANKCWPHGNTFILDKCLKMQVRKSVLLCATHVEPTHASRDQVYAYFRQVPFCTFFAKKGWDDYLLDMHQSMFVLSPRGNGIDCHRTWEALYMGAMPIVLTSSIDSVYDDLPVIILDDWAALTEDFLQNEWQQQHLKSFNFEKLYADYWFKQILHYQNLVRNY